MHKSLALYLSILHKAKTRRKPNSLHIIMPGSDWKLGIQNSRCQNSNTTWCFQNNTASVLFISVQAYWTGIMHCSPKCVAATLGVANWANTYLWLPSDCYSRRLCCISALAVDAAVNRYQAHSLCSMLLRHPNNAFCAAGPVGLTGLFFETTKLQRGGKVITPKNYINHSW